jgi:feruloyl esterase
VPLAGVAATPCADLAKLSIPNTTITLAQSVTSGTFTAPAGARGGPQQLADLPEFCRVQATLKPSSDSDIKMEVWMPAAAKWNGKLRGTGNGGLGGGATVNAGPLATGIRLGYATAGNNTGHEGDSSYALDHPEKIKDFGYRSAHEMTVTAKALIKAYYDTPLKYSVMAEGGGGTIAALSAAQRYPEDYDIIAVTGMSSYLSRHTAAQMWVWYATHKDEASFIPPDKYPVLHQAALNACDAKDGLKDGLISDPERCKFDPGVTQCKGAPDANCLTAPQVEAARKIYAGPTNPRTKEEIYSPLYPGSELGWAQLAGGAQPLGIPVEFYKYYVFRDRSCRSSGDCGRQCSGSGLEEVLCAWRETVAGRWLERYQCAAEGRDQLLQECRLQDRLKTRTGEHAVLYGARNGARTGNNRRRKLQLQRAGSH